MIEIQVDINEWCEQYGLAEESEPCVKCGIVLTTSIPVALKGYRGLKSVPHECGPEYDHYVVVPVNDECDRWAEIG